MARESFTAIFDYVPHKRLWYATVDDHEARDKTPTQALGRLLEQLAFEQLVKEQDDA